MDLTPPPDDPQSVAPVGADRWGWTIVARSGLCLTRGAQAAAIDSSLIGVLNAILAGGRLATASPADAAQAIAVKIAAVSVRALGHAVRGAAIDTCLAVVVHAILTR
jgi:hypothetical protein